MSQITRWPVTLFCQRMSELRSPLKSPEPTIFHDVGTVGKTALPTGLVPSMNKMTRAPVELFCQRISDLPSPLKSAFAGKIVSKARKFGLPPAVPKSVLFPSIVYS